MAQVRCCNAVQLAPEHDQRAVRWVATQAPDIIGYNVWRSADGQRANAELLTAIPVPVQIEREHNASYTVMDSTGNPTTQYMYWLQAVKADGGIVEVAFTTPSQIIHQTYLPVVGR